MKHVTVNTSPRLPVSHDPSLIKTLLLGNDTLPGIGGFSHIVLPARTKVDRHVHNNGYEVFYCIGGEATAFVEDRELLLESGHCLVIEPGETHGFRKIARDTELLYFFVNI